ncbi:MAG: heavy-metal-associated domain-containing protein [Desulfovibrio sp.]
MDFSALMDVRHHLSVAHHVPGRIRVKFGLKLLCDVGAKQALERLGGGELPPAILSARINPMGRSVVVEYDAGTVDPGSLEELLTTRDGARFAELAREFEGTLLPYQGQGDKA